MPNTQTRILFRKGLKDDLPTHAPVGEPMYCLDTNELYIGQGNENNIKNIIDDNVFISDLKVSVDDIYIGRNYYPLISCVGDGIADDSIAIQTCIDKASSLGIPQINFPNSKKLRVTKTIHVPQGISINGCGSELIRDFDKRNYSLIQLHGDNEIYGLKINGGSDLYELQGDDFINYCDLYCNGTNILVRNCKFDKSLGSSIMIQESSNITIRDCTLRGFLDHAIYCSSPKNQKPNHNIRILNNDFKNNSTTRDAIKTRNGVDTVLIDGNKFELNNGFFFTINTGDASNIIKSCSEVVCSNNIGVCKRFITFNSDNTSINIKDIVVSRNIVKVYDYFFGNIATENYSVANLMIENNSITHLPNYKTLLFQFNSNPVIGCGDIIIKNNTINFGHKEKTLGALTGKFANIIITSNVLKSNFSEFVDKYSNNLFTFGDNFNKKGLDCSFSKLIFNNNQIIGKISPIFGDIASSTEPCKFSGDISIMNNLFDVGNDVRLLHTNGNNYSELSNYLTNIGNIEMSNFNVDVKYNSSHIIGNNK